MQPAYKSVSAFRDAMRQLAEEHSDPEAGFFGPGSATWLYCRESVLFSMGFRALLLQVAHPKVARAVAQHSNHRQDPLGRAYRTFDSVFRILFGTTDTALRTAVRVYAIHNRLTGRLEQPLPAIDDPTYIASDPELLLWVYATLADSLLLGYETFFGQLPYSEKNRLYQEGHLFAMLFGVPRELLPDDWNAFEAYMQSMLESPTLQVTDDAREIGDALLFEGPGLLRPFYPLPRAVAAQLLPPRLVDGFGLARGPLSRLTFAGCIAGLSRLPHRLPPALRYHPAALEAHRRTGVIKSYLPTDKALRWLLDRGGVGGKTRRVA